MKRMTEINLFGFCGVETKGMEFVAGGSDMLSFSGGFSGGKGRYMWGMGWDVKVDGNSREIR